jgi:hypothetical protein
MPLHFVAGTRYVDPMTQDAPFALISPIAVCHLPAAMADWTSVTIEFNGHMPVGNAGEGHAARRRVLLRCGAVCCGG